MAKAVTAVNGVGEAACGIALAEPPSSAPTVRIPALQGPAAVQLEPHPHRYLPEVSADPEPLAEIGAAVGLAVVDYITVDNGSIADIVASHDGNRLLVTNYGDDSVSVIDTTDSAVVTTRTGLGEPFALATGAGRAYVNTASLFCDAIAVLDLDSGDLTATYPMAFTVCDVAVSPDETRVYASRTGPSGVDVAVVDTIPEHDEVIDLGTVPGTTAGRLALSPDARRLYLATQGPSGSALVVIDTDTRRVVDTIGIGSSIRDIALSRDGDIAYVASCDPELGGVVDIIDTRTNAVTGSVGVGAIGGLITQLTLSNDGQRAYLATGNGITVLSTLTHDVVATVTVDAQPSCMVESADGRRLYAADCSGMVTVVSVVPTTGSLVGDAVDEPEREPALV